MQGWEIRESALIQERCRQLYGRLTRQIDNSYDYSGPQKWHSRSMACGTQTPQAECWPHSMKRKSSSSLFQWTSWKENRRLLHTLLCRYVDIILKRGLSILSVFSTGHQNEIPQPENHIPLYLITCGLHLSEVHLSWCLISAFWFCKLHVLGAFSNVLGN